MSAEQATAFKNEGNKAFLEHRFQEAVDAFTKAIEINPNDHVFYSNRSGAYASLHKLQEALEDAHTCIKIKPDWSKGYQRQGHALYELGKLEEAISSYKIGLEYEPTNAVLKERLSKVEKELSSKAGGEKGAFDSIATQIMVKLAANPRTAAWLKDPAFMMNLQMLKTNPSMFPQLMQQDPRLGEAFNLLIGDFGGVPKDFGSKEANEDDEPEEGEKPDFKMEEEKPESFQREAYKPAPKKEEAPKQQQKKEEPKSSVPDHEKVKNEGNEFYKQKNFEKALECYNRAIDLQPKEVLYYNNKAAAYIEMKNYELAHQTIDQALHVAEENNIKDFEKLGKIFARKASILSKQGDLANSIKWYQKSLLEDKNEKVRLEMKQVERLKKEQDDISYINPAIAEEHNEKAKVLFQEGKFPLALHEYNEAVKRSPNDPKFLTNRGICYIKLIEFPVALRDLDRAIEIDPTNVKAYTKKGNCHFAMKEYHKALTTYEKGLKLAPDNQELKDLLAKTRSAAYMGGGDAGEQEERAKHAMADPEIQKILRTPEVQNALKQLQEDPKKAAKILSDPHLAPQIAKLVEAGILRMG